jgi:hypothetical protein
MIADVLRDNVRHMRRGESISALCKALLGVGVGEFHLATVMRGLEWR